MADIEHYIHFAHHRGFYGARIAANSPGEFDGGVCQRFSQKIRQFTAENAIRDSDADGVAFRAYFLGHIIGRRQNEGIRTGEITLQQLIVPVGDGNILARLRKIAANIGKETGFILVQQISDLIDGFGVRSAGPHTVDRIGRIYANAVLVAQDRNRLVQKSSLGIFWVNNQVNHSE